MLAIVNSYLSSPYLEHMTQLLMKEDVKMIVEVVQHLNCVNAKVKHWRSSWKWE